MGLSGNLSDASLTDIAQFIQFGGRTGTLHLNCPAGRGSIGFYRGQMVSAAMPSSMRLGEYLMTRGLVDPAIVELALHQQRTEQPRQSLGQILLALGAITPETLKDAIASRIVETMAELVTWTEGTFEFALDDLAPPDDVALHPGAILPPVSLDTRVVLLEAMQLIDDHDRNRRRNSSTLPPPSRVSDLPAHVGAHDEPAAEERVERRDPRLKVVGARTPSKAQLQVLTADDALAIALCADGNQTWTASRVAPRDAGSGMPGDPPPVVLVDLREDPSLKDSIAHVRRTRPRATILAVVPAHAHDRTLYEAGALALLPPDLETITACVRSVLWSRSAQPADGAIADGIRSGLARLRRVTSDLRAGALTSTVSLNLMHAVSESVERAILFVVRPNGIVALGAFGYDATGHPLAERTRGLHVPLDAAGALADCIEDGRARVGLQEDHPLPHAVADLLGKPRSGHVVILPVHGGHRTIAVVYADNGKTDRAIEGIEVLELAVTQVGLAFENEILRRQLRAVTEVGPA